MDFIFLFILFLEIIFFFAYSGFVFYEIYRRNKIPSTSDDKMRNTGRIMTWASVIGIVLIGRNLRDNFYVYFALLNFFLILYVIGFRLEILSFKVREENEYTFYYKWDQWLEKMYRKYLEHLWKNKEK